MRIGPKMFAVLLAVASVVPAYFAATCDRAVLQSEGNQPTATATLQKDASQSTASLELPLTFERHAGDLVREFGPRAHSKAAANRRRLAVADAARNPSVDCQENYLLRSLETGISRY